jgi:hypothetical protein
MKSKEDKFNKKINKKGMRPIPKKGEDESTGYNVNRDIEQDDKTGSGTEEFTGTETGDEEE